MNSAALLPPVQLPSSGHEMVVAAHLALSPQAAFNHFVTPRLLALWWPPEAIVEPRVGGSYRMLWPSMQRELFGQFTTFEPGERLAFTWQWANQTELPVRVVDVAFAPTGTGCRIVVTHGVYGDTAAEQEDRQGHIDGWRHFLSQLQALSPQAQA